MTPTTARKSDEIPPLSPEALAFYAPGLVKLALALAERDRAEAERVMADEHATAGQKVEAWRTLQIGRRVRVTTGYLAGREAVIVRIGELGTVLRLDGEEKARQYFPAGSFELVGVAPVAARALLPALVAA